MKARMHGVYLVVGLVVGTQGVAFGAPAAPEGPELVPAPVEKVFVPLGFDDNDNVEVIVHGHFRNTCYKTGPATAEFDADQNRVVVTVQAFHYLGVGCAQMLVPFTQSIKLGLVQPGTYAVEVPESPDAIAEDLVVVRSHTSDADDYLYAPVTQASLEKNTDGTGRLVVSGQWPIMLVGCMVMREVKTALTPGGVLVVQPIAAVVEGPVCDSSTYRFKFVETKTLTEALPEGEMLLHVRVLNGDALNQFVDLTE